MDARSLFSRQLSSHLRSNSSYDLHILSLTHRQLRSHIKMACKRTISQISKSKITLLMDEKRYSSPTARLGWFIRIKPRILLLQMEYVSLIILSKSNFYMNDTLIIVMIHLWITIVPNADILLPFLQWEATSHSRLMLRELYMMM